MELSRGLCRRLPLACELLRLGYLRWGRVLCNFVSILCCILLDLAGFLLESRQCDDQSWPSHLYTSNAQRLPKNDNGENDVMATDGRSLLFSFEELAHREGAGRRTRSGSLEPPLSTEIPTRQSREERGGCGVQVPPPDRNSASVACPHH
jgi:hypothetical protein